MVEEDASVRGGWLSDRVYVEAVKAGALGAVIRHCSSLNNQEINALSDENNMFSNDSCGEIAIGFV